MRATAYYRGNSHEIMLAYYKSVTIFRFKTIPTKGESEVGYPVPNSGQIHFDWTAARGIWGISYRDFGEI